MKFWTFYLENMTTNVRPNDLKLKKKQMKSENYEIYQYLVISYVEAIVKNWESFEHFVTYDAYKSKHLKERPVALRMIQLDFWDNRDG